MYWAAEGQGAYVQRGGQGAARLQCAEVDLGQPGLVVVGSASHLTDETREFVAQLKEPSFKQLGSSLKLLMVRRGARARRGCPGTSDHCGGVPQAAATPGRRRAGRRASRHAWQARWPEKRGIFPACALRCCHACPQVAEGAAHIYPRLAPTCEWDTAAAHVIVEEAGGSVLQAGLCDSKGKLLEDWKVGLRGECCLCLTLASCAVFPATQFACRAVATRL